MSNPFRVPARPLPYSPTPADVEALIAAARQHPLGIEYLREGWLDSVAVTFKAHAFTVIAARDRLTRSES